MIKTFLEKLHHAFNPAARREAILRTLRDESGGNFYLQHKALTETRRADGTNDMAELVAHLRKLRQENSPS